jgi:3-hydroxyisobutyrate dehydrogenase
MSRHPTIAFLGIGRMGLPMATNLVRAGYPLSVWNRDRTRTSALVAAGASAAASPREAVEHADIAVTMLTDGPALESVFAGPDGIATGAAAGLVWMQMGTIGIDWTNRLARAAAEHGIRFVDAPASGSEGPARAGQLIILASGPDEVHETVQPVFDVLGSKTTWLGPAGSGSRAKLVLNSWLVELTEATAETLTVAKAVGLDQDLVVDLLESSPLGAPYAVQKARAMLSGDFTPAFALKNALKDAKLVQDAARAGHVDLVMLDALIPRWQHATDTDHGDCDLAVVYTTADDPVRR